MIIVYNTEIRVKKRYVNNMKISTKGQYAIEIVIDLAVHSGEARSSLNDIALRRGLSEKYLERIIKGLKEKEIVKSVRGAYGGYSLERVPETLTILEILNAVEGELAPVHCLTRESECGIDCGICPTRATWESMWNVITDSVNKITVADLLKNLEDEE